MRADKVRGGIAWGLLACCFISIAMFVLTENPLIFFPMIAFWIIAVLVFPSSTSERLRIKDTKSYLHGWLDGYNLARNNAKAMGVDIEDPGQIQKVLDSLQGGR